MGGYLFMSNFDLLVFSPPCPEPLVAEAAKQFPFVSSTELECRPQEAPRGPVRFWSRSISVPIWLCWGGNWHQTQYGQVGVSIPHGLPALFASISPLCRHAIGCLVAFVVYYVMGHDTETLRCLLPRFGPMTPCASDFRRQRPDLVRPADFKS